MFYKCMAPTGYDLGLSATALYFLATSKQYLRKQIKQCNKPSYFKISF